MAKKQTKKPESASKTKKKPILRQDANQLASGMIQKIINRTENKGR